MATQLIDNDRWIFDKTHHIGVGRLRILVAGGGTRFRIFGGGQGGPNSQQARDVVTTSMRCNDVASTSFR